MTTEELEAIKKRLERLERLAFLNFQDVREIAEYAYLNVHLDVQPDEVKRIPKMTQLNDREALASGLALHELAALKMTIKALRFQIRRDVLGIVRDLMHSRREGPRAVKKAA